jgi:hypothetical protein
MVNRQRVSMLLEKHTASIDRVSKCIAQSIAIWTPQETLTHVPCHPPHSRYCWLDPDNCVMVDLALLNMETGQLEAAYPEGYWQYIAGVRGRGGEVWG